MIALNSSTHATSVKMLFDVSQIQFLLHALQVQLRGLLDLVIIFEPSSCSTGCSKGHLIGTAVTSTLHTRPGNQWLWPILSSEEVVPRWQWDQTGHRVLSRTWGACKLQQEFYLTGIKELLINVCVHHIELQNILNAPRSIT